MHLMYLLVQEVAPAEYVKRALLIKTQQFSTILRIWSFHVVVLQRTTKNCTKIQNACAELFLWSLGLLFSNVLIHIAVVVLSSLMPQ